MYVWSKVVINATVKKILKKKVSLFKLREGENVEEDKKINQ